MMLEDKIPHVPDPRKFKQNAQVLNQRLNYEPNKKTIIRKRSETLRNPQTPKP